MSLSSNSIPAVPFRAVLMLLTLLAGSLAMNVVLAVRRPAPESRRATQALTGMLAPSMIAKSVSTGTVEVVSYRSFPQPTVVYVFMPTCSWCARNRANIESLAQQCKERFHLLALSLNEHGVDASLDRIGIRFPAYTGASSEFVHSLGLNATPQLLVISPEGKVIENWIGAWDTEQQKEIETFFHVRLPGLLPPHPPG